jgi:hypothetical protein
MCKPPLKEILKIMDKSNFKYDLDIGPHNHTYYYSMVALHCMKNKSNIIDISKTMHYLINIMKIIYQNNESFDFIPATFYRCILDLVECYLKNKRSQTYYINLNFDSKNEEFRRYKDNMDPEDVPLNYFRIMQEAI